MQDFGFGDPVATGLRNTKCEKGVRIWNLNTYSAALRSHSVQGVTLVCFSSFSRPKPTNNRCLWRLCTQIAMDPSAAFNAETRKLYRFLKRHRPSDILMNEGSLRDSFTVGEATLEGPPTAMLARLLKTKLLSRTGQLRSLSERLLADIL